MKLISMTDFVLSREKKSFGRQYYYCLKYANFLKQPLTLGMFVPCDLDGNVLNDPETTLSQGNGAVYYNAEQEDFEQYEQAKERVLFEGFEFSDMTDELSYHIQDKNGVYLFYYIIEKEFRNFEIGNVKTIEDLVKYDLTLTESAFKQLGL